MLYELLGLRQNWNKCIRGCVWLLCRQNTISEKDRMICGFQIFRGLQTNPPRTLSTDGFCKAAFVMQEEKEIFESWLYLSGMCCNGLITSFNFAKKKNQYSAMNVMYCADFNIFQVAQTSLKLNMPQILPHYMFFSLTLIALSTPFLL